MKISKITSEILQSFTAINNGMMIHKGNRIRTQDNMNKIIAYADIPDEFPQEFAIYELGEFLSAIDLVPGADLDFGTTQVTIQNKSTVLKYGYGDAEYVTEAPEVVNYPGDHADNVNVKLSSEQLDLILKATNTLGLEYIGVSTVPGSNKIKLSALDIENPDANTYEITFEQESEDDAEYNLVFKAERLSKIIKQDYDLSIFHQGISKFSGVGIEYFIAIETDSTFVKV